jgi:hypothetical protein
MFSERGMNCPEPNPTIGLIISEAFIFSNVSKSLNDDVNFLYLYRS